MHIKTVVNATIKYRIECFTHDKGGLSALLSIADDCHLDYQSINNKIYDDDEYMKVAAARGHHVFLTEVEEDACEAALTLIKEGWSFHFTVTPRNAPGLLALRLKADSASAS